MGVFNAENVRFLEELDISPRKMVTIITGDNGVIKIKCNFCNTACNNSKDVTKHLMYECKIAGLKGNPNKKQIGGKRLKRVASEKYEISVNPRLFSNDELERKAFEIVGFYRREGADRDELISILQDFAKRNRQAIRKRQLEAYLKYVIQMMEMQGAYQMNDPRIASLIQRVHQLEAYLTECMSKMQTTQSNIAFAKARSNDIEPMKQKISQECEELRNQIAQLQSTKTDIEANLRQCQEDLANARQTSTGSITSAISNVSYSSMESSNSVIDRLENMLARVKQQLAEANEKIINLEQRKSSTSEPVSKAMVDKEIQTENNRIRELENNARQLTDALNAEKANNKRMQKQLTEMQQLANIKSTEADEQFKQASESHQRMNAANKKVEQLEKEIQKKVNNISEYEKELINVRNDNQKLNELLREKEAELDELKQKSQEKVTSLIQKDSEMLSKIHEYEKIIKSMNGEIKNTIYHINQIIRELNTTIPQGHKIPSFAYQGNVSGIFNGTENLENINNSIKEIITAIQSKQKLIDQLTAKIEKCEEEMRNEQSRINSIVSESKSRSESNAESLSNLEYQLKRCRATINELNKQIEQHISLKDQYRDQVTELQKALQSAKSERSNTEAEIRRRVSSESVGELEKCQNKVGELANRILDLELKLQGVETEKRKLSSQLSDFTAVISNANKKSDSDVENLRRSRDSLSSEVKTIQSNVTYLESEISNVRSDLKRCEEEKAKLKAQLRTSTVDSGKEDHLRNQIIILKENEKELLSRLEQLEREKTKSVSSQPWRIQQLESAIRRKDDEITKLRTENLRLMDIEAQIDAYKNQQSASLEAQVKSLAEQIAHLQHLNQQKENELNQYVERNNKLNAELIQTKAKSGNISNEIDEFKLKISALTDDINKERGNVSDLQREKRQLESELSSKTAEYNALESKIEQLEKTKVALTDKINELQTERDNFKAELDQSEEKLRSYENDLDTLKQKDSGIIDGLNEDIARLTAERDSLRRQLQSGEVVDKQKLRELNDKIRELESKFKNSENEKDKFKKHLDDFVNAIDTIITTEFNIGTHVPSHTSLPLSLQQGIEKLKKELNNKETVENEMNKLKDQIKDLEIERDNLKRDLKEKENEIKTLKSLQTGKIQDIEEELNRKKTEIQELTTKLRNAEKDKANLQSQVRAFQGTSTQRDTELQNKLNQISELEKESEELKRLNQTAEDNLRSKQSELDDKISEYGRLETENARLKSEISSLQAENARLKREIQSAGTTKSGCERELAAVKKELETHCSDQLAELKRNHASLVAELKLLEDNKGKYDQMDPSLWHAIEKLKREINSNDPSKFAENLCVDTSGRKQVFGNFSIIKQLMGQMVLAKVISNAAKGKIEALSIVSCKDEVGQLDAALKEMGYLPSIISGIRRALDELKTEPEEYIRAKKLNFLSVLEGKPIKPNEATASKIEEIKNEYKDFSPSGPAATKARNALNTYRTIASKVENKKKLTIADQANVDKYNSACDEIRMALEQIRNISSKYIVYINDFEDISGSVRVYVRINDYSINSGETLTTYIKTNKEGKCENEVVFNKSLCAMGSGTETYGPFYGVFMCMNNQMLYNGDTFNLNSCKDPQGIIRYTDRQYLCNLEARGIRSTIRQVLDGYRIAVFGYGYSGSGKTYTLYGSGVESPGIVQIALNEIKNELRGIDIVSIRELYGQGSIRDKTDYPLRMKGAQGDDYYIKKFKEIKGDPNIEMNNLKLSDILTIRGDTISLNMNNVDAAIAFINQKLTLDRMITGRVKATPNNPESSRGHLFVTFRLHKKSGGYGDFIVCDMGGIEDVGAIVESYFGSEARKYTIITNSMDLTTFKNALKDSYVGPGPGDATEIILNNLKIGRLDFTRIYNDIKSLYGTSDFSNIDLERGYILISQMINKKEAITELLYTKTYKSEWESIIDKNDPRIKTMSNKYGLGFDETIKRLTILRIRFGNDLDNYVGGNLSMRGEPNQLKEFLDFNLEQIRDVIREGFYINESLNHMKAYFKDKIGGYNLNFKNKNFEDGEGKDILKHINSSFKERWNGRNWMQNRVEDYYNKDRYFYLPYFEKGIPKKLWVEYLMRDISEVKLPQLTTSKEIEIAINTQVPGGYNPKEKVRRGEISDPIGMLTFLQDIATSQFSQTKPSKFIMLALLLPNADPRYCSGAEAALEFAQSVTSTRGHQTPRS